MKISLQEHLAQLPLPATPAWPHGVWDIEAFKHGTLSVILYTPKVEDLQSPHDQDELYVVLSGSGEMVMDAKRFAFKTGDTLFVPANVVHRFESFTDDLVTWAIFWGPVGGEK
jgi:mannose-6-phosphate isomerase-like protein (cupin superfamily)